MVWVMGGPTTGPTTAHPPIENGTLSPARATGPTTVAVPCPPITGPAHVCTADCPPERAQLGSRTCARGEQPASVALRSRITQTDCARPSTGYPAPLRIDCPVLRNRAAHTAHLVGWKARGRPDHEPDHSSQAAVLPDRDQWSGLVAALVVGVGE